jgi:hypothetical protein
LKKPRLLVKYTRCKRKPPIRVPQKQLAFIRSHNETLSVSAMCVCNPDRSPVGINRCDTAPTPAGFAEIVSDYFPVPHAMDCPSFSFPTAMTK